MIHLFALRDDRLVLLEPGAETPDNVVWIDLVHPTKEEETKIEAYLGIDVPTREEMAEIEVSSRLYRENHVMFMTAVLLQGSESTLAVACPVTFILAEQRLVTVRYSEPSVFATFVKQAQRGDGELKGADSVFAALLEAIVDRTADILEKVAANVDTVSHDVFADDGAGTIGNRGFKKVLGRIGRSGDLNSKVRESLVSIGRLVNFLASECRSLHPAIHERTETMAADIRSLSDHSSYVAGTIVFLLDATLGLINIEQSNIIKIVSVVSLVIMPPTLIASIYGMNFDFMPELHWRFGYPLALVAMVVAAIIPYWVFRWRGWL